MRINMRRTLAILLCTLLLLTLAPAGFAVDLTVPNTVTVDLVPNDKSDYKEDLEGAKVQADFYLLAKAIEPSEIDPDNHDDSYVYKIPDAANGEASSPFQAQLEALQAKLDELQKASDPENPYDQAAVFTAFKPLAQQFARVVLDGEGTDSPDPTRTELAVDNHTYITASGLQAGLYLLIIRGSELTTKLADADTDYVVKTENEDGPVYSTRVVTDDYEYLFEPQLLTVPTKLKDKHTQQYNTAYGDWEYELEIYAKPERDSRLGDLKIIKNLNNAGPDPVSFIFRISWTRKDGTPAEKVVSIEFKGEDHRELLVPKTFPIGTTVTVEEIYTGRGYTALTGPQTAVIQATASAPKDGTAEPSAETPAVATVTFTNTHDGPGGGHGILNHFTYIGSGNFALSPYTDSTEVYPTAGGNG